jgi:hypothetical protein
LSVSDRPSAYDRAASAIDDPRVPAAALALLSVLALSGGLFVVLPVHHRIDMQARAAATGYAAAVGCALVALFGFGGFGRRYFDGVAWPLELVRVCAFLTVPACAALLAGIPRMARSAAGSSRLARWHYGAIAISSLGMVLLLRYAGVLSFSPIT